MATLLIVHHTPSPACQDLLDAARAGASDPMIEDVEVVVRPALAATASDVLAADGWARQRATDVVAARWGTT